jgi:RNase adapter protein RapZ
MRVVLVTGISGSGKSIALNVLEDDGYYTIDNLPVQFLSEVIMNLQEAGHARVALSIDARSGSSFADLKQVVAGLNRYGHDVKILFLNARTDTLVQRFSETRRRHPLALSSHTTDSNILPQQTLMEAIDREREVMSELEDIGVAIDTSDLHPNALRQWVREVVGAERSMLTLTFASFAFKYGLPLDADLVFDVRCLPNPHYVPELKALSGLDRPVQEYLREIPSVNRMVDHVSNFLRSWLPHYVQENRSYLTVAIGCTGGQHRSVFCVEQLAEKFRKTENVLVRHRSLASKQYGTTAAPQRVTP